ncbi:hypothetical protein K469DRAFT_664111 [Zopfia rhizophila CBS 207.26]|uniref:PARG catalytic Macro domain-containing protein n=1 Tax=Zopfia rhizophila CBS 207.26 TaxID=1314779 RepID=A0A6A6E5I5_9PEZI|nr:hypothetical protein K469DRAFT_664111 [Zopfia rhizophila CBS 207.26]
MPYQLPTDPLIPCDDPLSIVDTENPTQWEVLDQLLHNTSVQIHRRDKSPADSLPPLIEDIAYSVHGNGSIDTGYLRKFCLATGCVHPVAVRNLLSTAFSLLEQFPSHSLPTLSNDGDIISYNGTQIDTLLAHQFFGTLCRPSGNTWGIPCLTSWFVANPSHPQAVDGYISTLLDHFAQGGYLMDQSFSFLLHTAKQMPDPLTSNHVPNIQLHIASEESQLSDVSESPFVLVAAHSQPGPGPTGTQEERLQSASPALSTSALFIPTIPSDAAVITSAFPVHAAWKGHNRTARLERLFSPEERPRRYYALADALPLDEMEESDGLKDLQPGYVEREVRKLYAAFSGALKMLETIENGPGIPCVLDAGAWGCGAFGGNVLVKTVCMMTAAGMADVEVHLTLLEQRAEDIEAIRLLLNRRLTTAEIWRRITSPDVRRSRSTAELSPFLSA